MDRLIEDEKSLKMAIKWIENQKLPFVLKVTGGRHRSVEQNKLQRLWCNEIAEQRGDVTAEYVRGELKLRFGVPIRRRDDDKFQEVYDAHIKPLPYETKVAYMMEPIDLPVTRDMTTKQKSEYLDAINQFAAEQGWQLTQPELSSAAA